MFHMMNEARLDVGFMGFCHASASYLHAVNFARQRIQGRALADGKNVEAPMTVSWRSAKGDSADSDKIYKSIDVVYALKIEFLCGHNRVGFAWRLEDSVNGSIQLGKPLCIVLR
jgi:hypothetical protein